MPFLDRIDPKALRIGAVNTVVKEGETLVGYNTDYYGIRATLEALGAPKDGWKGALVLGNGGAAKAVAAVLTDLSVPYLVVGRATAPWTFETLPKEVAAKYPLWIHCTPVGGPPYLRNILPLPYGVLTKEFAIFDLIYNPEPTALMERAADSGARTIGGRLMLETQAKHAWKLFREAYYKNVDDDERGSTTTA